MLNVFVIRQMLFDRSFKLICLHLQINKRALMMSPPPLCLTLHISASFLSLRLDSEPLSSSEAAFGSILDLIGPRCSFIGCLCRNKKALVLQMEKEDKSMD